MQKMFSLLKDLLGQGGEHTFTICLFSDILAKSILHPLMVKHNCRINKIL